MNRSTLAHTFLTGQMAAFLTSAVVHDIASQLVVLVPPLIGLLLSVIQYGYRVMQKRISDLDGEKPGTGATPPVPPAPTTASQQGGA